MKTVAVSVCEPLPPNWRNCFEPLQNHGFEINLFSTSNERAEMEKLIRHQEIHAVLDFAASDLIGELGSDRMTSAGMKGLPQCISLGGVDFHFGNNRKTTAEEMDELGKILVERACAASGPTSLIVPLRGFSERQQNSEVNNSLIQSIRNWVYPPELLIEIDQHFNDSQFGDVVVLQLLKLMNLIKS